MALQENTGCNSSLLRATIQTRRDEAIIYQYEATGNQWKQSKRNSTDCWCLFHMSFLEIRSDTDIGNCCQLPYIYQKIMKKSFLDL